MDFISSGPRASLPVPAGPSEEAGGRSAGSRVPGARRVQTERRCLPGKPVARNYGLPSSELWATLGSCGL